VAQTVVVAVVVLVEPAVLDPILQEEQLVSVQGSIGFHQQLEHLDPMDL